MGITLFGSSSYYEPEAPVGVQRPRPPTNPNPSNFEVLDIRAYGTGEDSYVAVKVKYPDATSYEGIKVMVVKCTTIDVINAKVIDPHFTDQPNPLPVVARFAPTDPGWRDAMEYAALKATRG